MKKNINKYQKTQMDQVYSKLANTENFAFVLIFFLYNIQTYQIVINLWIVNLILLHHISIYRLIPMIHVCMRVIEWVKGRELVLLNRSKVTEQWFPISRTHMENSMCMLMCVCVCARVKSAVSTDIIKNSVFDIYFLLQR